MSITTALLAAAALALVHAVTPSLHVLAGTPRSVWLSLAGGVSVAYVFVHLLPERAEGQRQVSKLLGDAGAGGVPGAGFAERHVYVAALAGLVYNALIGYLLLRGDHEGGGGLALFTVAMALHFVVTDFGLDEHHQARYRRIGRWLLAAAVFLGLGVAVAAELPEAGVAVLVAFLAGGVILNVLKEEVPSERQSRFSAFALGVGAYAALLLAV